MTDTVGAVTSRRIEIVAAVETLFAASRAVTVMTFMPVWSAMPAADQVDVPAATPEPPRSLAHETSVTPTLSVAATCTETDPATVLLVTGEVTPTVGGVVSEGSPPDTLPKGSASIR